VTADNNRSGTDFGKYRIVDMLGKGGMGEVYEAFDTEKNRTVALKILAAQHAHDDQFRARFLRESHAAAILQEPHVVPIHDWGEIDGNLYIDMRLIQGATLHGLINARPLEPQRAVSIIQQIAAALDAAHAERLLHRDVKPQNIIVTPADFAYLVDFGIAEAQGDTHLTMAGTQIGSFSYMAPERFDDAPCSPASDVYSLACVLYESVTGETPFASTSQQHVIAAHIAKPPPRASSVNRHLPLAIDDVIARGMAKDPDDRYGSAGALGRAALRAISPGNHTPPLADANTMARPYSAPLQTIDRLNVPGVPTGPTAPHDQNDTAHGARNMTIPLVAIGAVAVLLLSAVGIVVGMLVSQNSNQNAGAPTTVTVAQPAAQASMSPIASPSAPQPAPLPPPKPAPSAPSAPAVDQETSSTLQLRQLAANDRPYITAALADYWIPQLSAKRPGVVDQGMVWDNTLALQEHLQLRQRYNAKLLWTGDWSTFDGRNFWVTVVPITFSDSSGALLWCAAQGFDRDHCIAKIVSNTRPVAGSTATN
jgi:serine/threonine kinase PknH